MPSSQVKTFCLFSASHLILPMVLSMDCSTARVPEPKPTSALSSLKALSCDRKAQHGKSGSKSQCDNLQPNAMCELYTRRHKSKENYKFTIRWIFHSVQKEQDTPIVLSLNETLHPVNTIRRLRLWTRNVNTCIRIDSIFIYLKIYF